MIMASAPQPAFAKALQIRKSLEPIAPRSSGSHFPAKANNKPKPWSPWATEAQRRRQSAYQPPETLLTQLGSECMIYIEANPLPEREQTNLASAVKQSAMRSHAGSDSPSSSTTVASRTNITSSIARCARSPQQETLFAGSNAAAEQWAIIPSLIDPSLRPSASALFNEPAASEG
ncbi:hypothetical protein EV128_104302 [Rhizobium azibense]|nr:hypothetical protein EV128_104302 [Rhizobium azibense]